MTAALAWDPVVVKELRSLVRGWHPLVLLTACLCLVGGAGCLAYSSYVGKSPSAVQNGAGSEVFSVMAIVVMAAVALVVPGLVGPSISGEREHRTLDLLLVTPLSPARIVAGKLVAAVAFVLFLVVACLPLFMVAFVLGRVALPQVLEVLGFTVMVALSVGALSMMASVALRGVVPATVVSYLAMLVLTVGPLLGGYALQGSAMPGAAGDVAAAYSGTGAADLVAAVSPVAGADGLLGSASCSGGTSPPVSSLGTALASLTDNCGPSADLTTDVGPLGTWQTWEVSLACNGAIAAFALAGSILVLRRREVT